MHRAGQRCFELLALIGSPQLSYKTLDTVYSYNNTKIGIHSFHALWIVEVDKASQESTMKDIKIVQFGS